MRTNEIETAQRSREWLHQLRLPPGTWTVVRVDGRGFSKLTADLEKPFDGQFSLSMEFTAGDLLEGLDGAVLAYTESDEISVVLPPAFEMFGRSVEKLVSVSAGLASAWFTSNHGVPGHFDSRVWLGSSVEDVVDYLSWRQAAAARGCLNGWVYWTLRQQGGLSARSATSAMVGEGRGWKHDTLRRYGVNFNDLPLWQRRGTGLWWEQVPHEGVDPRTGKAVPTTRRRIHVDQTLPMREEFRALVYGLLSSS